MKDRVIFYAVSYLIVNGAYKVRIYFSLEFAYTLKQYHQLDILKVDNLDVHFTNESIQL